MFVWKEGEVGVKKKREAKERERELLRLRSTENDRKSFPASFVASAPAAATFLFSIAAPQRKWTHRVPRGRKRIAERASE